MIPIALAASALAGCAAGALYRYGIRHALVGNGLDSNGNEIDFEAMPSRQ